MSGSKTERLLTLLNVLLDAQSLVTAAEIRARVPGYAEGDVAFRRTFERDKAELGEMLGHPIRAEPVPGTDPPVEGYRLRPQDAYLRDPGLSPEERTALAVASSAVRLTGVDPTRGALKVGVTAPPERPGAAGTEIPADASVVALFQAVVERREVTFGYRGEQRHVQPQQLRFARGWWYLTGDDLDRGAERLFRLDRFESVPELGPPDAFASRHVERHERLAEPWALGDGPAEEVVVLVDASRAEAARRAAGRAEVRTRPDGDLELVLSVRHREALIGFVLGFLDGAEVLSPPAVRDEVVTRLRAQVAGGAR